MWRSPEPMNVSSVGFPKRGSIDWLKSLAREVDLQHPEGRLITLYSVLYGVERGVAEVLPH